MRRVLVGVLASILLLTICGSAQSLGDVARQTRQKEKAKGKAAKKVITNEDIPESPDANAAPREIDGKLQPVPSREMPSAGASADEWKQQILARKNAIAKLQAQMDKLNASIHYVEANAYYNGVQYNQQQARKQQQVEQMKESLAEQKKSLEEMQEAARKAGLGSAVYDP